MSDKDLVFSQQPALNADLVFGETSTGVPLPRTAEFAGTLPGLTLSGRVVPFVRANFAAQMPAMTLAVDAAYDNRLTRYLQGLTSAAHQTASPVAPESTDQWQPSEARRSATDLPWGRGVQQGREHAPSYTQGVSKSAARSAGYQQADKVSNAKATRYQIGKVVRNTRTGHHTVADRLPVAGLSQILQIGIPVRRWHTDDWQVALPFFRPAPGRSGASILRIGKQATVGRWQVALGLPAGKHPDVVIPPPGNVCYTPDGDLVFIAEQSEDTSLLFKCDGDGDTPPATVVVPVRKVYVVTNNIQLTRVSDGANIACDSASLSLDVDSWTWSFNASMPGSMLPLVQPGTGPVEVNLNVNGTNVRLLLESVSRERTFGSSSLRVTGRGINAELDAPYAAVQNFAGYATMGAQQLVDQVLTLNNIPLGWGVNWQLEDWLIPGGVFNHQGTYISAINAIVGAAGGYLQPSLANKTMGVKHRYPLAPWEWSSATADISLPSDVVVQEGLQWMQKPDYNRVYVSGQGEGIVGRVTRAGTAGDLLAPMVTDPLIVAVQAARQRGRAVLSNTGRQVSATLGLPVLQETGIILPGTLVDYVDGATTRRGLVRSVNLSLGFPSVWQSIQVETHL